MLQGRHEEKSETQNTTLTQDSSFIRLDRHAFMANKGNLRISAMFGDEKTHRLKSSILAYQRQQWEVVIAYLRVARFSERIAQPFQTLVETISGSSAGRLDEL